MIDGALFAFCLYCYLQQQARKGAAELELAVIAYPEPIGRAEVKHYLSCLAERV